MDNGGNIRSFNILKEIAREHQVHLLSIDEGNVSQSGLNELKKNCASVRLIRQRPKNKFEVAWYLAQGVAGKLPYPINKNWSDSLLKAIKEEIKKHRIEVLHFNHLDTACYVFELEEGIKSVFDSHNLLAGVLKRYGDMETSLLKMKYIIHQAEKMLPFEGRVCREVSLTLACSQEDAGNFKRLAPGARVEVIPNGVNLDGLAGTCNSSSRECMKILFLGAMDYLPNSHGVIFFVREVLPTLIKKLPDIEFQVVGRNPPEKIRQLAGKHVKVLGRVPDIQPYFSKSALMAVPIFIGGGTRIKILEAMAAGLPVVSTRVGIEGIGGLDGRDFLVADSADKMVEKVLALLENRTLQKEISVNARRFVENHYTWEIIGRHLRKLYGNLA